VAEEISIGNLSRSVAEAGGNDEVGSLAVSFERMRLEMQRILNGLKNEIARRKRSQEAIRLLQHTTLLISKADSLDSAFAAVLRRICEFTGWAMGEIWVLASENRGLECGQVWRSQAESLDKIIEESRKLTFGAGEGLVGETWVSQRPLWISDISQSTNFLRKQSALAAGVKTVIFIPIIAEVETLAVMDFFTYESLPRDDRLINLIFTIISELGPVILRKRYEQELLRANQELQKLDLMKSEFIANVSHELRTPLAMIKEGISQSVEGLRGELSTEQRLPLEVSLRNVNRLTRIINSILEISSYDARKAELKKEAIDIVSAARQSISQFSSQAREKGLEIKENFSHPAIECSLDKEKIIQVFSHLIYNAVKFTDSGCIEVAILDKDGTVECSVSDTGIGIHEEDIPRVFERFLQFHRAYGPGEKGVGLGLSIIKEIVELHQGKIWVKSELGRGTTFSFSLPKA
jgi:signal transduction histidine kinase